MVNTSRRCHFITSLDEHHIDIYRHIMRSMVNKYRVLEVWRRPEQSGWYAGTGTRNPPEVGLGESQITCSTARIIGRHHPREVETKVGGACHEDGLTGNCQTISYTTGKIDGRRRVQADLVYRLAAKNSRSWRKRVWVYTACDQIPDLAVDSGEPGEGWPPLICAIKDWRN